MRAVVYEPDARRHFSFAEAPEPVPGTPDELLIEVKAISLNFGEVYSADNAERPGDIPGWDSAGVVVTAAADGSGPPVGARVVGAGWSQAWAQRRVLKAENVAVLPDSAEFQTASALPVAGVTAVQTIRRLGSVVGRRVLVPAYHPVAVASGSQQIYLAGQVSWDADGVTVAPGDLTGQIVQVFRDV
ncbi:alcohol dehydrogenase catalytic domain-containing protein [Mycobacterium sp. NPDC003323]